MFICSARDSVASSDFSTVSVANGNMVQPLAGARGAIISYSGEGLLDATDVYTPAHGTKCVGGFRMRCVCVRFAYLGL